MPPSPPTQQHQQHQHHQQHQQPQIQVIGAGLGRTGTKSLQTALDILGYKTYHFPPPYHASHWASLAPSSSSPWSSPPSSSSSSSSFTPEMMLQMIAAEGFTATCDQPTGDFYFEQFSLFPDSKVILTVRDSPEKWERSWKTLMNFISIQEAPFSLLYPSPLQFFGFLRDWKRMRDVMGVHLGLQPGELIRGWKNKKPGWLGEQYEKHNEQVKKRILQEEGGKDRLLVFNVKEGWEPLCKFLGKEVPNVDFPFVNESKDIENACRFMKIITYTWIPVVVTLMSITTWFIMSLL